MKKNHIQDQQQFYRIADIVRSQPRTKTTDLPDDIVMVDRAPETPSGPEELAFDVSQKDRPLKRSNTAPKRSEGLFGFLGSLRKPNARKERPEPQYYDDYRADTDRDEVRRRKKRPTRVETDPEGFTTDAGLATEAEDIEARKARRRAKRASRHAAEQEARDAELRDAEERRARRREEKSRAREERDARIREEEEREDRRREEKRARRAARERQAREEEIREYEARSNPSREKSREKRRARDADETADEGARRAKRSERRRSHAAEKSKDGYGPEEYSTDHRHRSHRSSEGMAKPKRRRSTAQPAEHHASRHDRSSKKAQETPYPVMANGGKDKTTSWVHSQLTDPPEAPPVVPTVVDVPPPTVNGHTLSSDEEARRAMHGRSKRRSRHHTFTDAEIEDRRASRHAPRRTERGFQKSSEGSGDGDRYYDYSGKRHGNAILNGGTNKRSSWFKKLTNL